MQAGKTDGYMGLFMCRRGLFYAVNKNLGPAGRYKKYLAGPVRRSGGKAFGNICPRTHLLRRPGRKPVSGQAV